MDYRQKYLKYKQKYLELKNLQGGQPRMNRPHINKYRNIFKNLLINKVFENVDYAKSKIDTFLNNYKDVKEIQYNDKENYIIVKLSGYNNYITIDLDGNYISIKKNEDVKTYPFENEKELLLILKNVISNLDLVNSNINSNAIAVNSMTSNSIAVLPPIAPATLENTEGN